ncbi:MAG: PD-(D/E)XK nuclease-like domain-containing protein, partial [Ruminiclostridium sp.]|nr:PD-(D/E)XK nuclease-like domain-containing protein [Ruminiclostridium sp.]
MIVKNTNEEYHSGGGISKSDLDLIHTCPEKYRYKQDNPGEEQTPALLFGSAVHKLILEPERFYDEYAVFPACDKRTKDGKAMYHNFIDRLNGRTEIPESDFEVMCAMRDAVMCHQKARTLLTGGITETSY